eukprot:EG_transcript_43227
MTRVIPENEDHLVKFKQDYKSQINFYQFKKFKAVHSYRTGGIAKDFHLDSAAVRLAVESAGKAKVPYIFQDSDWDRVIYPLFTAQSLPNRPSFTFLLPEYPPEAYKMEFTDWVREVLRPFTIR